MLQQFDYDPGSGFIDYACGTRAYDGHRGVDFGLATDGDMQRNVPVIAAAAGRVLRVREGETDGLALAKGLGVVPEGRDCGNGVILEHGGGWQTIYCHMARGSVAVREGQTVTAGQPLGAIGMSGRAEFAHLHFGVLHKNRRYDPFLPTGPAPNTCGSSQTLSTPEAAAALRYSALDLVATGISDARPVMADIVSGRQSALADRNAEAFFGWILAWNTKQGDVVSIDVRDPSGASIISDRRIVERGRRRQFRFAGARPQGQWRSGRYTVTATIQRSGPQPITRQISRTVNLR